MTKKPVRTISGVAVVAAMTSPHTCPHGKCLVCPGGPSSVFKSPQSYTGKEPAAMRAERNAFDPYKQVSNRLRQLIQIGHPVNKVELIVMGGTITARSVCYQEWFVKRCLEAMNDYSYRKRGLNLEGAQRVNERVKIRNTGITFETRPDYSKRKHVDRMLSMGITKVELGVQNINDEILQKIRRGHDTKDSIEANSIVRDSAIKVGFHMMPGLPGSSFDDDLEMFKEIFSNPDFKPDYLKIYPTLVAKDTRLYELWQTRKYDPLDADEASELIARVKSMVPRWVRVQRIQRDVPSGLIEAGVTKSNLRQLTQEKLRDMKLRCRCIRCREAGHALLNGKYPEKIDFYVERYEACDGIEYFLSYEDLDKDILIGFLRLRVPSSPHRPELRNSALIRDLHVYGHVIPIGERRSDAWQHKGYGRRLLEKAEDIALDEECGKITVMSGVGVREYYRRFGYERDGPFMSKIIGK